MLNRVKLYGALVITAALTVGCSESNPPAESGTDQASAAAPDTQYLMAEKPADAQGVGDARQSDAEDVTVVGRIGGDEKPFVDGIAAFTIVDPKVPHCAPDEGCPTPWDYCCTQDQVQGNKALVKIVGSDGKSVMKDARGLLGVKELSTVIVRGKAKRDEEGNLTVLADQVYVEKK